MKKEKMASRVEDGRILVLERTFDAPRELVFRMFSECEHLEQWWGPRGWDLPVCRMDFRPGGTWHYCMKCVDESQGDFFGMESWGKQVYQEIVAPEKIVYIDYFSDAEGTANEGTVNEGTLQFIDQGRTTKLVNRSAYASEEALETVMGMGMLQGVMQTWDRLEERLAVVA